MKILIRDPCRFVLLGKEIFLGSMGNPRNKPKVLPWITWYFNMAHRAMIWWFIFSPVGHPRLKKQPPKGPSLIRHQKCTNRAFYIKSLIKKKYHVKILVWDDCGFMPLCSFGKRNLPGKYGEPLEPNQRFYHGYPDILTWPTVPWFGYSRQNYQKVFASEIDIAFIHLFWITGWTAISTVGFQHDTPYHGFSRDLPLNEEASSEVGSRAGNLQDQKPAKHWQFRATWLSRMLVVWIECWLLLKCHVNI